MKTPPRSAGRGLRAAQYIRMSTDGQQFSEAVQAAANAAYAAERGYELVRTYSDLGLSGVSLKRREGLQRLLKDVLSGTADFDVVLVHDVSRWGRFQDPDEAAHYEFLCREAGIRIEYCAEMFDNDGSLMAAVMKGLRRVMAADFSRELGDKVLAAQLRAVAKGFKMGGPAPYALRRMMIDAEGAPKQLLAPGEYKALRTDRVVMTLGPPEEVAVVARAFRLFVFAGMTRTAIADLFNAEGVPARVGDGWTQRTLTLLLTNEAYAGVLVFNRQSYRLGKRRTDNAPEQTLRVEGAIPAIVRRDVFAVARRAIGARFERLSDAELLDRLRGLLEREGRLTWRLVAETEGVPCPQTYRDRFGSLVRAFDLVGFQTDWAQAPAHIGARPRRTPAYANRRSPPL